MPVEKLEKLTDNNYRSTVFTKGEESIKVLSSFSFSTESTFFTDNGYTLGTFYITKHPMQSEIVVKQSCGAKDDGFSYASPDQLKLLLRLQEMILEQAVSFLNSGNPSKVPAISVDKDMIALECLEEEARLYYEYDIMPGDLAR